ncbi:unnamed protein product [Arabis nemorensis]|uniref:NYN domain-containing protein n=1 Tax=Arabis nemorensis TaxID=586526 RepID=A0A565C159_9BRAS|nr:unnamed protein product [Arabis nemorensis]
MSADLSDAQDSPMIKGEGLSKVDYLSDDDYCSSSEDSSADEEYLGDNVGFIKYPSEEEDLSKVEEDLSEDDEDSSSDVEEDPTQFAYLLAAEDYSMFEYLIYRGPHTCLFWNLEDYPIPESADFVSIHRNIKLALHRMGVHGWLDIWVYGDKPNHDESDLYDKANITYIPKRRGPVSIPGRISVDILEMSRNNYPDRTAYVVIAKQNPELKRVLQCLQLRYHHACIIVEPQDGLFQSADSLYCRALFVDGGKTMPRVSSLKRLKPVLEDSTGLFWDAKDFPFPVGVGWSPDTVYTNIMSCLTEISCVMGDLSISSYVDEKKDSWADFLCPKSRIDLYPAGNKKGRLERMLNDILLWSIHYRRANLIVVSDNLTSEFFDILEHLGLKGYRVFLATPSKDTKPKSRPWPQLQPDQVHFFGFGTKSKRPPQPKRLKTGDDV